MSTWDLPTTAEINGREFAIRSDYRAALDALDALGDPGISDAERGALLLAIVFPDHDELGPGDVEAARDFALWFLRGGEAGHRQPPRRLADWRQDFPIIVGPVNRVLGYECRAAEHLHWWTFLAAYCEIGDCLFAQVVAIRKKLAEGRKLKDYERRFYREHRDLVELRREEGETERELFEQWTSAKG